MGLTIYTRHPGAAVLRTEVEEAKVEVNPTNGMVTVTGSKGFLANISATDFALMVTDDVTVTP